MVYTKNHYIVFVTLHEKLNLYWYDLQGKFLLKQQIKDKEKQISKTIFVSTLFPNMVMEKSDTLYFCNHLLSKDTSEKYFYLNKIKIGKSEKLMTYFPATPTNICHQQIHVNEVKIVGNYFVFRNIFSSSLKFFDINLKEVGQFSEKDSEIKCPDTDSLFF